MSEQEQKTEPALTQEQADQYIADEGAGCPFCGDDQVEGGSFDFEGNCVYQRITCLTCQRSWTDSYTLDGIAADVPTNIGGVAGAEPGEWFYRTQKPDLLDALQNIEANLTGKDCPAERVTDSLNRARTAIAKAKKV